MVRGATGFLVLLLGLAVVAFWPSYLATFPAGDAHVHTHAALMLLWFGLLFVQPMLVRSGRLDLHRTLGRLSCVLVPLIALQSLLLAHARIQLLDDAVMQAEGHFLFLPLAGAWLFLAAWALGVAHRRRTPMHARFMLGTALALIDPVVARLLFFFAPPLPHLLLYSAIGYGLTDALLLVLLLRERPGSPARRAYALLLAVFGVTHLLWFTLGQTPAWLAFAYAFRGLGGAGG